MKWQKNLNKVSRKFKKQKQTRWGGADFKSWHLRGRSRQISLSEASIVYILSSRIARATGRHCLSKKISHKENAGLILLFSEKILFPSEWNIRQLKFNEDVKKLDLLSSKSSF